jgi:hypothetical protein
MVAALTSKTLATPKPPPSRARRALRRVGQALLIALFVGVVAGGWAYHRARAQVGESLMGLGAQMMAYADARSQDAPRDLVLNGEVIRFSSGTADRTADQVLDFFEARCASSDGGLYEQVRAVHEAQPDVVSAPPERGMALREDDGARGYVACIDFGSSIGFGELTARIDRYGESGDVSDIGEMRYVFVEQYEQDGAARTHFVTMWTTGSFNIGRMFPEEGDAPGRDIEGVGRPPGARRVLTGFERGVPYSMSVYQSREDEADLERFYRRALEREGFSFLEGQGHGAAGASDAPRTVVAEQGERMVTIVFTTDVETGGSSAAVIEAR